MDPQAGGPSNGVRRILGAYPAAGCEGEVVTLDHPDAPFLAGLGFRVHALGPVSMRFGFNTRLIPWLRAERDRFDGVVVHGVWQYLGYAVRRAIHPHKPYLVFTHGMLDPWFKRAYPFKHIKKLIYWWLNEYWVLRNARHVLFTSAAEARLAATSFWPSRWNTRVVPYGATGPRSEASPARLREAFLQDFPALALPDGSPRPFLLFLGRIHPKKGCDLLLDAFAQAAALAPDLHLVFAGPDGSGLQQKLGPRVAAPGLAQRVHWIGMVNGTQKWGAFYASQAFVLPSHQENFGIAVAEALACGKPVLISDKVNIWEDLAEDRVALVGPDTAAGTLSTLQQWIALDPAEKSAMGTRALDCFHRRYDTSTSAEAIINCFLAPAALPAVPGLVDNKVSAQKPV